MPSLHSPYFDHVSQLLEQQTNEYVTLHGRPCDTSGNFSIPDVDPLESVAIVIQGPILADRQFTLESIRLYLKIFPFARVVLSTWCDQPEEMLAPFRDLGIELVLSKKPDFFGLQNINLQIVSSAAGIFCAEQLGCRFVVKTRSDIRIYAPDFFLHCLDLISGFPLDESASFGQVARLVSVGEGGKYAFMVIPDRIMFGTVADMKSYWCVPLDTRVAPAAFGSLVEMAEFGVAESYLSKIFCNTKGISLEFSLNFYWNILRDYFVFMDQTSADIYWCKHNRAREFRNVHYFGPSSFDSFGFKEWFRLYRGTFPFKSDSRIILRPHGALLSDLL
jgi:hypothetical protein